MKATRLTLAVLAIGLPALAAQASSQTSADAVYLFAYRIKPGQEAAFDSGYRRHLDWHVQHRDSLSWLGWTVTAGTGLDMFVDGTFGITPQAFDARVDPRADAADADSNITPYADPVYRYAYRLRRELGSSDRLEKGRPAPMQVVSWFTIRPGQMSAFERAVGSLRGRAPPGLDYAVYERRAGGPQPAYLLVIQVQGWAQVEEAIDRLVGALLRLPDSVIAHADTEVWRHRPEWTLIPAADAPRSRSE